MNCFEIIKTVLDEAFVAIPGNNNDKVQAINNRLAQFRLEYSNLLSDREIDYRDPVSRCAYVYAYVTSHANMVAELIRRCPELQAVFSKDRLTVSCIGGGPGSDILGILKFLTEEKLHPRLTCFMLDRNKTWNEAWCDLDSKVDADFRLYTNFMEVDVCQLSSWQAFSKYLSADVFTFVYFTSELYGKRGDAEAYFRSVLASAKPGALIMFVDNNDERFYNWFDDMTRSTGFQSVLSMTGQHQLPHNEEKRDLAPYVELFTNPKSQASIVWRVYRKE